MNFQVLIQEDELITLHKKIVDERRFIAPEQVQIKVLPTHRSCGSAWICVWGRGGEAGTVRELVSEKRPEFYKSQSNRFASEKSAPSYIQGVKA